MSGAGPGPARPPVPAGAPLTPSIGVEPSHPPPEGSAEAGLYDPLAESFSTGREGRLLFFIAVAFSTFQLLTALGLLVVPSQIVRAVHVGFLLLLAFPLIAAARRNRGWIRWLSWVAALLGAAAALYQWVFYRELIVRSGYPTDLDLIVGSVLLFLGQLYWRARRPAARRVSG